MRLAISNIAWDVAEDEEIATLLKRFGIDAIDVAPGKYFPNPIEAMPEDILRVKKWWSTQGFEITGMQALLFGTTGLNVFGPPETQDTMLQHLAGVCRIGSGLGAKKLVFGSPKNRDRSGLNDQETMSRAISFFQRLGDIAQFNDVIICLEPNPICYGANFMTTSIETAMVVDAIKHPSIKMQFDTGALYINNENPVSILQNYAHLIGHIHASEANLLPLGDGGTKHAAMALAINQLLPDQVICIEMVATKNEPHVVSIERSLTVAIQHYQNESELNL